MSTLAAALVARVRRRPPAPSTTVNLRSVTTTSVADGRRVFGKTSELSLAREAEVLARESTHRGPVQAIPFVAYDADRNQLVTEYVAGNNLFNILWNGTSRLGLGRPGEDIGQLVRGVAGWLAAFHRRSVDYATPSAAAAASSSPASVEAAVHEKLDRLSAMLPDTRRHADFVARLRDRARSLAEAPGWDGLNVCVIHGDFTTGNILVDDSGRAFVADFADARIGFALEDVVRFWSSIWELSQCGRRRRATFQPLLDEFLASNDVSAAAARSAPFTLMRAWNSVTKLLEVQSLEGRVGLGTMVVLRRIGMVHRRWLHRLCAGRGDGMAAHA